MSTVKSKNAFDAQTLNLPEPTSEDLAALERAGTQTTMAPEEYLQFLVAVTRNLPAPEKRTDSWPEPFEL